MVIGILTSTVVVSPGVRLRVTGEVMVILLGGGWSKVLGGCFGWGLTVLTEIGGVSRVLMRHHMHSCSGEWNWTPCSQRPFLKFWEYMVSGVG